MRKYYLLFLSLILLSRPFSFAAVGDWQSFTSANDVRDFIISDSLIWCATNGGALRYNRNIDMFYKYTNTEGLSGNDVAAVELDFRGYVWAAVTDGVLNILDPNSKSWLVKTDYRDKVIQDLYAYNDSIFVAMNIGVSIYNASNTNPKRWEVKENYYIGDVRRTMIIDGEIWTACKDGVRKINLDYPNLQDPSAWTTYTTADGLSHNETLALFAYNGWVVVGCKKGVSIYDGTNWLVPEIPDFEIRDVSMMNNTLIAATSEGIFLRKENGMWTRIANQIINARRINVDADGVIWLGLENNGLARLKPGETKWTVIQPGGPPTNNFSSLIFDHSGKLWATSPIGGVSRFDGSSWMHFSAYNGKLKINDYRDLAVDQRNRVWAASWGNGITIFETADDSIVISEITSSDNRLSGIAVNPNYVVVTKLCMDQMGNMWILNYQANSLKVLVVSDPQNNWQYFSTLDGIKSTLVTALEIDSFGRKWIGMENAGVIVLADGNTPFDKSDDDLSQGLGKEDGLESLHVRSFAQDMDGLMWIGTPEGLFYWFEGSVRPRYAVINDNVNAVAVDVRNNKWIGTSGGLSRLDADGFTWEHFSTSNSPLVSDNVTCFAFNENTGEVFIGTTNGMSKYETPFTKPASNLNMVAGYPNPFVLGSQFHIDNLAEKSSVRIYAPDGFLIRYIPASQILGSRVDWDGTNDRGDLVSSGIYIYLVTTESGASKTGKIAVIHP